MALREFPGSMSIGGSTVGESIALELDKLVTGELSLDNAEVRTLLDRPIPQSEISMIAAFGKSNKTKTIINASSPRGAGAVIDPSVVTGYTAGNTEVELNIDSGVALFSTDITKPALTIRGFVEGDTVTVNISGGIIGIGGHGGDANQATLGGAGEPGGTAILVDSAGVTLNVLPNGFIAGGGGGGGAGKYAAGFASGGGGAGGGRGGNSPGAPGGVGGFNVPFGGNGAKAAVPTRNPVGGGGGSFWIVNPVTGIYSYGTDPLVVPDEFIPATPAGQLGAWAVRPGIGGLGGGGSGAVAIVGSVTVTVKASGTSVTVSVRETGLFYNGAPTGIGGKGGGMDAQGGNAALLWYGSASPIAYAVGGGGGGFGASGGRGYAGINNTEGIPPALRAPGGTGGKAVSLANGSVVKLSINGGRVMGGVS